jgi:hypothetical protein
VEKGFVLGLASSSSSSSSSCTQAQTTLLRLGPIPGWTTTQA